MKYLLFSLILMYSAFVPQQSAAQAPAQTSQPLVELIEDKQEKRWNLYAQNNTDEEQEAFLIVKGEGFRRSADRPVIKKIPPNEKVLMITLIPLKGVTPNYTKIFPYETNLQTIEQRKGENKEEHVNIRPLKSDELTIFLEDDCEKCNLLVSYLNKNHIKYRKLDLGLNGKVVEFMWDNLRDKTPSSDVVTLPVIMDNNEIYHNIPNMKYFIDSYSWKKPK